MGLIGVERTTSWTHSVVFGLVADFGPEALGMAQMMAG